MKYRLISVVVIAGAMALLPACTAEPLNRPIALGPGPGTLEATRKALEGTWTLASLEVLEANGVHRAVKATGRLTYDAYGNMSIHGTIRDAAEKNRIVLDYEGRIQIDIVKHEFYAMDLQGTQVMDPDQIARIAPDKLRRYELSDTAFVVTYLDKAGHPTAVARWKR